MCLCYTIENYVISRSNASSKRIEKKTTQRWSTYEEGKRVFECVRACACVCVKDGERESGKD